MKRIIVFFAVFFCIVSAKAQISISDRYYINRAKAEIKAEEAAKETKVVIIGAREGILSYVVRDGKRVDYEPEVVFEEKVRERIWRAPFTSRLPKEKVSTPENPMVDENAFASMVEGLYADGWTMAFSYGTSSGEVYIFEKRVAKAKSRLK